MNYNLRRPKRISQEDEDDLIEFQEKFLQNKNNEQPAAKCIRTQVNENQVPKLSAFIDLSNLKKEQEQTNIDCSYLFLLKYSNEFFFFYEKYFNLSKFS